MKTTLHQLHQLVQAALRSHGPDAEVLISQDGCNYLTPILRFHPNHPHAICLGPVNSIGHDGAGKRLGAVDNSAPSPFD